MTSPFHISPRRGSSSSRDDTYTAFAPSRPSRSPASDHLVGRFFGIRIGISTHAFNFAAGVRVGRTPGTGGAPNPPRRRRPSSSIEDGGKLNGRRQRAGSSFLQITRKNDRGRRTTTTRMDWGTTLNRFGISITGTAAPRPCALRATSKFGHFSKGCG
jgi:hypothetical protein